MSSHLDTSSGTYIHFCQSVEFDDWLLQEPDHIYDFTHAAFLLEMVLACLSR